MKAWQYAIGIALVACLVYLVVLLQHADIRRARGNSAIRELATWHVHYLNDLGVSINDYADKGEEAASPDDDNSIRYWRYVREAAHDLHSSL